MKKILFSLIALLCLSAVLVGGCSSIQDTIYTGLIIDKQFTYKNFDTVEISGAMEYEISQASYYSVVGTASKNHIYDIQISQTGKTLLVSLNPGNYSNARFKVTITMPILTRLVVSEGARGNVTGFDPLEDYELLIEEANRLDPEGSEGRSDIRVGGANWVVVKEEVDGGQL